jgi:AraC-like DNA-binding protein
MIAPNLYGAHAPALASAQRRLEEVRCARANAFSPAHLVGLAFECDFDVRHLAGRLGCSQWSLQRRFKSMFQCSPGAWLRELRLQSARILLHSAASVKEVAYELRFPSQSQFSRDYKARFGYSPKAAFARGDASRATSGPVDVSDKSGKSL